MAEGVQEGSPEDNSSPTSNEFWQGSVVEGQQEDLPGGQQGDLPGGQQGDLPGGQQEDLPGGQQGDLPGGQREDLPGGQQGELPGGQQEDLPGGQQEDLPGDQQGDQEDAAEFNSEEQSELLPEAWLRSSAPTGDNTATVQLTSSGATSADLHTEDPCVQALWARHWARGCQEVQEGWGSSWGDWGEDNHLI